MLAEEGDDISDLSGPSEAPSPKPPKEKKEEDKSKNPDKDDAQPLVSSSHTTSSSSTASPTQSPSGESSSHGNKVPKHTRPLFPSVLRLLMENGAPDVSKLQGSGIRGQLTKGDVLVFLGKIDNPLGTASKLVAYKPEDENKKKTGGPIKGAQEDSEKIMTGAEFRRWIAAGMASRPRSTPTPVPLLGFDDVVEGYLPKQPVSQVTAVPPVSSLSTGDPWDDFLHI